MGGGVGKVPYLKIQIPKILNMTVSMPYTESFSNFMTYTFGFIQHSKL